MRNLKNQVIWEIPEIVEWCELLCFSFHHWLGYQLINWSAGSQSLTQELFDASKVVVSHGLGADPLLNFANREALQLWGLNWDEMIITPSRLTAETVNQKERQHLLDQVSNTGYYAGYSGVRITKDLRRFRIEEAIIWNIISPTGERYGQAATFNRWVWL